MPQSEHRIRCPYCGKVISDKSEARAQQKMGEHIRKEHGD